MAAVPERDGEAVVVGGAGVGLVLDGGLVQGVPADGALGEWGRKSRRVSICIGGRAGQGTAGQGTASLPRVGMGGGARG